MGKTQLEDGQRESAKFLLNKSLSNAPETKDLNLNFAGAVAVTFE